VDLTAADGAGLDTEDVELPHLRSHGEDSLAHREQALADVHGLVERTEISSSAFVTATSTEVVLMSAPRNRSSGLYRMA
jgi:hypothetical protein